MQARLIPYQHDAAMMKAFIDFSTAIADNEIEQSLRELVKVRASQLNGCAFCLHMHTREALDAGESELRLTMLAAWRESPLYTDRERAALAWADALTTLVQHHVSDEVYAELDRHFSKKEQVQLTMVIAIINAWNRFGAGFRSVHPVERPRAAA